MPLDKVLSTSIADGAVSNSALQSNLSFSGNVNFSSTGARITGDFNNATIANRLMFQGSVVNGGTVVTAIPNGTSASCQLVAANASDPTNAQIAQVLVNATEASFRSAAYGTGTGTYLPMTFYTGGSEAMRIDTSRNVGIGAAPSYRLDVQGGTASFAGSSGVGAIRVAGAGGSWFWIDNPTTTTMRFSSGATAGSTTNMTLENSGNVGIGTTLPATRLDVYTTTASNTTGVLKLYGANGASRYTGIDFHGVTSETYNKIAQITALVTNGGNGTGAAIGGDIIFRTNNSSSDVPTEKMRIDANGNVGIGTSSYSEKLSLNGNVRFQTNNKTRIEYLNSTAAYSLGTTGGAAIVFEHSSANHEIAFETHWTGNSHAEQMRITKEGNLKFNSGYGSVATAYGCRAWVNFNGTGVVAIRASGNVTSITDNGAGDYTVNFTTAMTDANYSMTASASCDGSGNNIGVGVFQSSSGVVNPTTSAARMFIFLRSTGGAADVSYINAQIAR